MEKRYVLKTNDEKHMRIVYSTPNFSTKERSQINNSFSRIIPTKEWFYARESAEVLPAVLVFSFGFISGAIATGFFEALGTDLYKKAKEIVIRVLSRKNSPSLVFEMEYNDTKIKISSRTSDRADLDKIFNTIGEARDLAVEEIDKKETPEMTELVVFFDNGWGLHSGQNWKPPKNVAFYSFNKDRNVWEITGTWSIRNGIPYKRER